jgi:uncharacterized protein (TIGR02117 family)
LAIFRKIARYVLRFFGVLFLLVACYIIAAFILGIIPVNKDYVQASHGTEIYISSNGVHLDIIMPVATGQINWRDLVPPEHFPGAVGFDRYVGFGWGERNFYIRTPTWADLRLDVAINAMFWPTVSAMHVNYYRSAPRLGSHTISITLDDEEIKELQAYIYGSFQLKKGQAILIENAGYDVDDNFYEARGKYHMFYTSNDWVNEALKKIGVRSAVWSPFDKGLLYQLRKVRDEKIIHIP